MTRRTVETTYCAGTVHFTEPERCALLGLLISALRKPEECGVNLAPLQTAYGRLLAGNYMTREEVAERLPEGWGLRPDPPGNISQAEYDRITAAALRARGEAITNRKAHHTMTEYLVTDTRNGRAQWVAAANVTAALFKHEQSRRLATGETPLQPVSRAAHDSSGPVISASLGDSCIRGLRSTVIRESVI